MEWTMRTARLWIRPLEREDAPTLNRIANQPHVLSFMPDWASSLQDTEELIQRLIPQVATSNKTDARILFAVELAGEMIGLVGIGNKQEVDNEIELAFFIDEAHAGRGYTTEAARVVCRRVLSNLGMDYLIAIIEPGNIPSRRVVEKCGFRKVDARTILNSGEIRPKLYHYYRLYH